MSSTIFLSPLLPSFLLLLPHIILPSAPPPTLFLFPPSTPFSSLDSDVCRHKRNKGGAGIMMNRGSAGNILRVGEGVWVKSERALKNGSLFLLALPIICSI